LPVLGGALPEERQDGGPPEGALEVLQHLVGELRRAVREQPARPLGELVALRGAPPPTVVDGAGLDQPVGGQAGQVATDRRGADAEGGRQLRRGPWLVVEQLHDARTGVTEQVGELGGAGGGHAFKSCRCCENRKPPW